MSAHPTTYPILGSGCSMLCKGSNLIWNSQQKIYFQQIFGGKVREDVAYLRHAVVWLGCVQEPRTPPLALRGPGITMWRPSRAQNGGGQLVTLRRAGGTSVP